jgi:hypothetical protein
LERALLFRETNNLNLDLLFAMDIAKVKSAICATDAEIVFIDFAQNIYSER